MGVVRVQRLALIVPALLALGGSYLASQEPAGAARLMPIARAAWAGSSVNVVANARQPVFTHGRTQFAAFYDGDRFMVLARRSIDAGAWERRGPPTRERRRRAQLDQPRGGRRRHPARRVGSPRQSAELCARHRARVDRARTETADDRRLEGRVTYPQFHRLPGGDLLFLYRDGASGRGTLVLTRYAVATGRWSTVHTNLIDGEGERSPYWDMTIDRRGALHLAWIWRESPDVATNHDICYAKSDDEGRTWSSSGGSRLAVPISVRTAEYAARIPQQSNLMNSPAIAADEAGRPYVTTYWSSAPGAPPRFRVVHHDGAGWRSIDGPAQPEVFTLAGGGTKAPPISRAVVLVEPAGRTNRIHLVFRDPGPARGGA